MIFHFGDIHIKECKVRNHKKEETQCEEKEIATQKPKHIMKNEKGKNTVHAHNIAQLPCEIVCPQYRLTVVHFYDET